MNLSKRQVIVYCNCQLANLQCCCPTDIAACFKTRRSLEKSYRRISMGNNIKEASKTTQQGLKIM